MNDALHARSGIVEQGQSANRIETCFSALHRRGRKALIPFITAGDPHPDVTVPLMHAMVAAGVDIIELGVPFSDPMADGPVIQRASERALKHGMSLTRVLERVGAFRADNDTTPVVLMGYLNPIEVMGYEAFAGKAREAGVDGVLTVDLPPEEAGELMAALQGRNLAPIFLLAPTSSAERIAKISRVARGFVYYVSIKGVTGGANLDVAEVADKLSEIRKLVHLPVGVGFGIKDAATAAQVAGVADAIIVGSALIKKVEDLLGQIDRIESEVTVLLAEMRRAMDKVSSKTGKVS